MRLILPGVALHVIQRGVNRSACFHVQADYLVYLSNLRQLSEKHECAVHAYCLMTNHVHLLLTPATARSCTGLMRDLGRRYVPYFNRRHQRTGTLWEGRFRSCMAESERYVLACYRYIELNPVRAGMVEHPAAYYWSSHIANSGMRADAFLSPHPVFTSLGTRSDARQAAYRALCGVPMDEPLLQAIRDATNSGYPLTSDAFKDSVLAPLGWKIQRGKPGRQSICDPAPELAQRFATLTPN